jgi:hypothetical protein
MEYVSIPHEVFPLLASPEILESLPIDSRYHGTPPYRFSRQETIRKFSVSQGDLFLEFPEFSKNALVPSL